MKSYIIYFIFIFQVIVIKVFGQNINQFTYIYDDLNRLTEVQYGNGTVIEYAYDQVGNRTLRVVNVVNSLQPDVAPTNGVLSLSTVGIGGEVTLTYKNENIGAASTGGFTTYVVLSDNATYEPGTDELLASLYTSNLAPGAMPEVSEAITIPASVSAGIKNVLVLADYNNDVDNELSENNNVLIIPIAIADCSNLSITVTPADETCEDDNGTALAAANGGAAPYQYTWSTSQSGANLNGLSAGNYSVSVLDQNACEAEETFSIANQGQDPVAGFSYSFSGLTVSLNNNSAFGTTYSWTFGDGGTSNLENPMHTYAVAGDYTICLNAINSCGANQYCVNITLSNALCDTPSGLSATSITQTAAMLGWNNISGALSYNIRYRQTGQGSWESSINTTNVIYSLSGLAAGTSYEVQTETVCGAGNSGFSSSTFFSTQSSGGSDVDLLVELDPGLSLSQVTGDINDNSETFFAGLFNSDLYVLKANAAGEEIWTKKITNSILSRIDHVFASSDGGLIICSTDQSEVFLHKLDAAGNLQWQKNVATTDYDLRLFQFTEASDGSYIGVGWVQVVSATSVDYGLVIKLDANGNLLWKQGIYLNTTDDFAFWDVEIDAAQNIYVIGDYSTKTALLVLNNSNGAVLEQYSISHAANSLQDATLSIMEPSPDPNNYTGIYLRFKSTLNASDKRISAAKLDKSSGNVVWAYGYGSQISGTIATDESDGGVLFTLENEIVKLDNTGEVVWANAIDPAFALSGRDLSANGNQFFLPAYGATPFNLILSGMDGSNDCAFDPIARTKVSTAVNSAAISFSTSNTFSLNITNTSDPISNHSVSRNELCGACNTTAGINAATTMVCQNQTVSLFYTGVGATTYSWKVGVDGTPFSSAANVNYTFANAGVYTVYLSVTDGESCTDETSIEITVNAAPSIFVNAFDEECLSANGFASVDVSAVSDPQILWSTGETTTSISDLAAGNYSVQVTNADGCATTQNFTINNTSNGFTVSGQVDDVSCAGAGDGVITLSTNGAQGSVSYIWSTGSTSNSLTDLAPGSYYATISDAAGCIVTASYTINEPQALTVNVQVSHETAVGANDASATAAPSGGTLPYAYNWSTGATTATALGLSQGDYSVTITDANACTVTELLTVSITACTDPAAHNYDANATIDDGSCETCSDGIQNGDETGVDCGGALCDPCGLMCPDLIVSNLVVNSISDNAVNYTVTIKNIGNETIYFEDFSPGLVRQAYASIDDQLGQDDPSGGWRISTGSLSSNEEISFTSNTTVDLSIYNYLLVVIDNLEELEECNENNNTGAVLLCDQLILWHADTDGDSYGDPNQTQLACNQPVGYVLDNTDCDDANANLYPAAPELCDGLDNDCNGQIDEILECSCASIDSLALVALYNSANGPNWTNVWDLSQPMSTWYGVQLNGEGCVTCLDLDGNPDCAGSASGGNNLIGNIPAELGNLANLATLVLSENQLSGSIPPEMANLTALTQLYLQNNQLSSCFPAEMQLFCSLGFSSEAYQIGYNFTGNPGLPWQGDFSRFCNNEEQIGASCDDGNANTSNDVITADCECVEACATLAAPVIAQADTAVCLGVWTTLKADDGSHSSLYFDGLDDSLNLGNSTSLQITGDLTIEMWLKPSAFDVRRNPINKAFGGEYTITQWENGNVNFYWGSSGDDVSPYEQFYSSGSLNLNEWNHIAIVRDVSGGRLRWYINGALDRDSLGVVVPGTISNRDVIIGSGYQDDAYQGYIDEVRIWNKALSSETILAWDDKTINSDHPDHNNLAGYWSFDEGIDSIVFDQSANNNHGVLINGPVWSNDLPELLNMNILWSTGDYGDSIRVSPVETMTYTVQDINSSCVDSITVIVGASQTTVSATVEDCDNENGEAVVQLTGGEAPYQVQWADGQSGTMLTNLLPGLQSALITDNVGCQSYDAIYLPGLKAKILEENAPICSPEALSLAALAPGVDTGILTNYNLKTLVGQTQLSFTGTHSYTYPTEVGKEYLVLVSGVYTVWNGCEYLDERIKYFDPAFFYDDGSIANRPTFYNAFSSLRPLNDQPNPYHAYAYWAHGDGANLRLYFHDTQYIDNCGQFNVEIWELEEATYAWSDGSEGYTDTLDPSDLIQEDAIFVNVEMNGRQCVDSLNLSSLFQTLYLDADGDGFGDRDTSILGCPPYAGYVENAEDCDDNLINVYPGASCDDGDPNTSNDLITADCICLGSSSAGILINTAVYLQGAYELNSGLMRDILRSTNTLPLEEPYAALGFTHIGGGGEAVSPAVLTIEGMDAIVDWVFLELRDPSNHNLIVATRSALLQRDGDVVEVDGVSSVVFENAPAGDYYLSVKHRNHLGVMSATPTTFSSNVSTFIDFTSDLNQTFGTANGIASLSDGNLGLYSGDFNRNGQVQNTDYNEMLFTLGTAGYAAGDFDLNGQVQNTDLQLRLVPNIGKGQPFGQ